MTQTNPKHQTRGSKAQLLLTLLGTLALMVLSACSQVYITATPGKDVDKITVQSFQERAKAQWIVDDQGRPWTNRRKLHITGDCTRGVAGVDIFLTETGKSLGRATCTVLNTFDFVGSVDKDGVFDLQFQPLNISWAEFGVEVPFTVVVSTVAPAAPIIETHGGVNFVSPTRTVVLRGTVEMGVSGVRVSGAGKLDFNAEAQYFEYTFELNEGETRKLDFFAVNLAGVESDSAEITVSFRPGFDLAMVSFTTVHDESYATFSERSSFRLRTLDATTFLQVAPTASQHGAYLLLSGIPGVVSRRK